MYKQVNVTQDQIKESGFDFGQRVRYTKSWYKGQQGVITGFDGDYKNLMVYVEWDQPEDATTAPCVDVNNLEAV